MVVCKLLLCEPRKSVQAPLVVRVQRWIAVWIEESFFHRDGCKFIYKVGVVTVGFEQPCFFEEVCFAVPLQA